MVWANLDMNQKITENGNWHLDKRVNISIILALVLQTVGIVWSVATVYGEVRVHESRLNALDELNLSSRTSVLEANIISITTDIRDTKNSIQRIENILLDRLPKDLNGGK